jgi:hypothetical protein
MVSFEKFISGIKRDPNLREGQQFMNEIFNERVDLYWIILNDGADCFYDNGLLPKAKEIAANNWHL